MDRTEAKEDPEARKAAEAHVEHISQIAQANDLLALGHVVLAALDASEQVDGPAKFALVTFAKGLCERAEAMRAKL